MWPLQRCSGLQYKTRHLHRQLHAQLHGSTVRRQRLRRQLWNLRVDSDLQLRWAMRLRPGLRLQVMRTRWLRGKLRLMHGWVDLQLARAVRLHWEL